MGPPTPFMWKELVTVVSEMDVGARNKQILKAHMGQLEGMESGEVMMGVRMVRVGKTFN